MFRWLKVKLVVINLTLICMVLLLVFVGINWYVNQRAAERSLSILQTISQSIGPFDTVSPQNERVLRSNSFYVTLDTHGQIIEVSPNAPPAYAAIAVLTLERGENAGNIAYNQENLWYLKTSLDNGTRLVYLQDEGGSALLSSLTDVSLAIGGVSVLLALAVSIVLANRALHPIHRAWGKQQAFVADASHELRTPLAVLNTNLEVVMDSPSERVVDQFQWLTNMKQEITRMSVLVESLLFLARADAKSDVLQVELFSLSDMLRTVSLPFVPLLAEKCLRLEQSIQQGVKMKGMESRIRQLLVILLDNAMKNTPRNGQIRISMHVQNDRAHISIADTGIGIPPEQIKRIFERFYRIDQSRTREQGGAGLGLSIAECIVHEHKGTIHVQSEPGKGSTFTLIFPL